MEHKDINKLQSLMFKGQSSVDWYFLNRPSADAKTSHNCSNSQSVYVDRGKQRPLSSLQCKKKCKLTPKEVAADLSSLSV